MRADGVFQTIFSALEEGLSVNAEHHFVDANKMVLGACHIRPICIDPK